MQRCRTSFKLSPDEALFRRRAAGEPLRELALDYHVSHTSLSRYFKQPEAIRQLKRAEQLSRAEQRIAEARSRAELRASEKRRRARLAPAATRPREHTTVSDPVPDADSAPSLARVGPQAAQRRGTKPRRAPDPYQQWLDRPKNLGGLALAEASGLVRLANPEGTSAGWFETDEARAVLEAGWTPA